MKYLLVFLLLFTVACGIRESRVKGDTRQLLKHRHGVSFSVHRVKRFCNEGNRCPRLYSVVCTPEGHKRPRFTAWVSYENQEKKAFLKSDSYLQKKEDYAREMKIKAQFEKEVKILVEEIVPVKEIKGTLIHMKHYPLYRGNNPPGSYSELDKRYRGKLKRLITVSLDEKHASKENLKRAVKKLMIHYGNSFYLFLRFSIICEKKAPCKKITLTLHREDLENKKKTLEKYFPSSNRPVVESYGK